MVCMHFNTRTAHTTCASIDSNKSTVFANLHGAFFLLVPRVSICGNLGLWISKNHQPGYGKRPKLPFSVCFSASFLCAHFFPFHLVYGVCVFVGCHCCYFGGWRARAQLACLLNRMQLDAMILAELSSHLFVLAVRFLLCARPFFVALCALWFFCRAYLSWCFFL